MALAHLAIPPTSDVAFEDSTSGIKSGFSAGIPTVGIASIRAPKMLSGAGAFAAFRDFTDPGFTSVIFG